MNKTREIIGEVFGRLEVKAKVKIDNKTYYECECICGNIKTLTKTRLLNGDTKSCGCLQKELVSKRKTTHGQTFSPTYNT